MARIGGVNIPSSKRVEIGLTYIFGIGRTSSRKICESTGVDLNKRVHELTDGELGQLRSYIDEHFSIEGDLRREVSMNIKRLLDLRCYRGLRHRKGLPVRGQRTNTNARTRKGKAVPIAGKKK